MRDVGSRRDRLQPRNDREPERDEPARPRPAPANGPTWPADLGLLVVLFWIVVAPTVQWWAPYDPLQMVARRLRPPSAEHWLGTDALGRDVLTRTLFGAQQSLPISVIVVLVGAGIGSALGAIAGFLGGVGDAIIMRAVDITLSLPAGAAGDGGRRIDRTRPDQCRRSP